MERILQYKITADFLLSYPSHTELTVGNFLRSSGYSRHLLTQLKLTPGSILKNDIPVKLYEPLVRNDRLTVRILEYGDLTHAMPSAIPLSIVYEDEDILVIDKPAFMPVHPSHGHRLDTLANAVNYYYEQKNNSIVYRCINRLDRDTSGLILIAKHMLSGCLLSDAMKNRKIHRTYMAVVYGAVKKGGCIDLPIGRKAGSAIERCIDPENGERAVTYFEPLSFRRDPDMTLLKIRLETGRTHQIRVHMTHIGHPLVGDFLYTANAGQIDQTLHLTIPDRQALHSSELIFRHPITEEELHFSSPLPEDLCQLFSGY